MEIVLSVFFLSVVMKAKSKTFYWLTTLLHRCMVSIIICNFTIPCMYVCITIHVFILGIAMTGVLVGNTDIVTGNLLTDYSIIRDTDNGLVARCVSGLGPTSSDDNTALGIWYFNGAPLPYGLCEDPVVNTIQSRIAGVMNFIGVINLWQCVPSLNTTAEGVYTCVILDSSMMNQTTRVGIYFSGRSKSLDMYPITSLLTIFHLSTQLLQ